jgi:surface protein
VAAASCPLLTSLNLREAVDDYIAGGGNGNYVEGSNYAGCGLIGTWDVSAVTDMKSLFDTKKNFDEDISNWDTSSVTNMKYMFYDGNAFNQDISGWNVSNVTDMFGIFWNAYAFDQNLSGWCVKNVSDSRNFQNNSGFVDDTAKHPQWGTCPQ